MKILGIESSCDETAASVVEDGVNILSNVVVSQIDIFAEYGGVIPEIAARSHLEAVLPVVHKALADASCTWDDIDAIAVTYAPGLLGSLLVGTLTARTLAILHNKPLYAVHHLKSHIYANWLGNINTEKITNDNNNKLTSTGRAAQKTLIGDARSSLARMKWPEPRKDGREGPRSPKESLRQDPSIRDIAFPLLSLVISGGHTQILYMPAHNQFEIIGTTHDDAIGECFDKVAKILGLPYPGGPAISRAALTGDRTKYKLPHPQVDGLDFSFSGLKTAVLRAVQKEVGVPISYPSSELKNLLTKEQIADFAASFEKTAIDILLEKLNLALRQHPEVKSICFAGGVSANKYLREKARKVFDIAKAGDGTESSETVRSATREGEAALGTGDANAPAWGGPELTSAPLSAASEATDAGREARNDGPERPVPQEVRCDRTRSNTPTLYFPSPAFSGDNAAMVSAAAYFEITSGVQPTDPYSLDIYPRIAIS